MFVDHPDGETAADRVETNQTTNVMYEDVIPVTSQGHEILELHESNMGSFMIESEDYMDDVRMAANNIYE